MRFRYMPDMQTSSENSANLRWPSLHSHTGHGRERRVAPYSGRLAPG